MAKSEEQNENVKLNRDQMQRLVEHVNEQTAAQSANVQSADVPTEPGRRKDPLQLGAERVTQAEYSRNLWVATAVFGTTIQDVRDEAYFAHVASKLKPYDRIEVRTDDGSWFAELLVTETGRNWARTYLLSLHKLTTSDIARTMSIPTLEVVWKGPHLLFCVIRKSDKEILQDKCTSEAQAYAWIRNRETLIGT